MPTVFNDVEPTLVAYLATQFPDALVSVKKPDASTYPYPSPIITVRSDGGNDSLRGITRLERIGVNVWANDYADASTLAVEVDSALRACTAGAIKLCETMLSPVRVPNDGPQEQRYMTYQLVVKATDS